jgi:putative flippase GtrA
MTRDTTRFLRFGAVGALNTALTVATFALLTRAGVAPGAASALGFALGAANGYLLNRTWTFNAQGGRRTFGRYVAVQALGALLSAGGVSLATDLTVRHLAAECAVVPLVTLVTYTLARHAVFLTPRPSPRV